MIEQAQAVLARYVEHCNALWPRRALRMATSPERFHLRASSPGQPRAPPSERIAALEAMRRELERMARKPWSAVRLSPGSDAYCHIIESA